MKQIQHKLPSSSSLSAPKVIIGGKFVRDSDDSFSFQQYARDNNAKKNSTLWKRKKDLGAFLQYPQWVRVYPDGHLEVVYGGDGAQEKVWATYKDTAHINRTFDMKFDRDYAKVDAKTVVGAKQPGTKNLDKTPLNHDVVDGPLHRLMDTLKLLQSLLNKFAAKWESEQEAYLDGARDSWDQISAITFSAFPRIKTQTRLLIHQVFPLVFELLDVMTFDNIGKSAIEKEKKAWEWFRTKHVGLAPSYAAAYASHANDLNTEMAFAHNLLVKPDANYKSLFQFLEKLRSTLSMLHSRESNDEVGKTSKKTSVGAKTLKHIPLSHDVLDGPIAQVLVPLRALEEYLGKVHDYFKDEEFDPKYKLLSGDIHWDGISDATFQKFPRFDTKLRPLVEAVVAAMFPLLEALSIEGTGKKVLKDLTQEYVFFRDKYVGVRRSYAGYYVNYYPEIKEYLRLGEVLLRDPDVTFENLYAWIGNIRFPLAHIYYRKRPDERIGWADGSDGDGEGEGEDTGRKIKELLKHMPVHIQNKWANDCLQHVLPEFERAFPGKNYLRKIIELRKDFVSGKISESALIMGSPALFPFPSEGQDLLWHFYAAAMTPFPYEISQHAAEAVSNAQNLSYAYDLEQQWQLRRLQEYDAGTIGKKTSSVGARRKFSAPEWRGSLPKVGQSVRTACPIAEEATICRNWNARLPEVGVVDFVTANEIHLQGVVRPFTRRDNGSWVLKGYGVTDGPYLEPLTKKK